MISILSHVTSLSTIFMLVTSPRNNVQISHQARHVFQVLSESLSSFLLLTMVSLKHSISLYISISIFYFTPLISHHLPLSSHGFNPPIMPSRSKIQYKASPYPRSSNAGVSLLRLKIWDLGNKERGDWGVRTMYWSVRGLG